MRKLFIFLLIALSSQAFPQVPGSFFNFDDPYYGSGSVPFFEKMDDPINPTVAFFYPSTLKTYIVDPLKNDFRFGIALSPKRIPEARFEINASPMAIGEIQTLYPALKVYGGNYGLDVQGAASAIFIHNDDVNSTAYGIYQTGGGNLRNYFNNKIGIGIESPEKMLDIAGDLRCTGPAETGTGIILKSTDISVPFPIYTNGTSIQFQFPYKLPSKQITPGQTFSLMTLTSNNEINQVEIAGTTNTLELNVTNSTNTGSLNVINSTNTSTLNVGHQTTTTTFKMIDGAGINKAMISDENGQGQWTDINPWLNRYWENTEDKVDIFTHARNVGIGVTANDDITYANNRLSVFTNTVNTGLYVTNQAPTNLNRHGISSNLNDPGDTPGGEGTGIVDMPGENPGVSAPVSIGIDSKVSSKTNGIGLTGISSTVSDNGASSVPIYGIKSLINGVVNTNQKYALYSEIIGGNSPTTPRWAGYFKGGDVEINYGSFIIGIPTDKRFCMQTH
jgi:hypothetical protein